MLKSPFFEEEKIRTKPEAEWLYGQKKKQFVTHEFSFF